MSRIHAYVRHTGDTYYVGYSLPKGTTYKDVVEFVARKCESLPDDEQQVISWIEMINVIYTVCLAALEVPGLPDSAQMEQYHE